MAASRGVTFYPSVRRSLAGRILSRAFSAWRAYLRWYERRAAKHHLHQLDDRILRDIGISRSEIDWAIRDGRSAERL